MLLPRPTLICLVAAFALPPASEAARKAPPPMPSRMERISRVVALEDARSAGQGELERLLRDGDRGIRRRAALAAGRIGLREAVPLLVEMMNDGEPEVRQMAAFSLGLIADATAVDRLVAALGDGEAVVRARSAEALGRIGDARAVPALAQYVRKTTPPSATTLVIRGDDPTNPTDPWAELRQGLLALSRLGEPKALEQVLLQGTKPRYDWWLSASIASRAEAPSLAPVLALAAQSNDVASRTYAAKGLGVLKGPAQLSLLATLVHDSNDTVVISALRALGATGQKSVVPSVAVALESKNPLVVREALRALSRLPGDLALRQRIVPLVGHEQAFVRGPALVALAHLSPAEFTLVLSGMDPDPDFAVRSAVATALGESGDEVAINILFSMLKDPDPRVLPAVLGALRQVRGRDAIETLRTHLEHADPGVRAAAAEGLGILAAAEATPALANAWQRSLGDGDLEARIAIVEALQAFTTPESTAVLTKIATQDPVRAVRLRGAFALGARKQPAPEPGVEVPSRRPHDYRLALAPYDPIPGERLYSPRALLHTKRGVVEILLDVVETPLTSATFIDLAQRGFFDGLTFHRVEPGFVVQGGDPRGDGSGGPGFTLRCEIAQRSFGRGSVGMALSGRDTGGSQFFVTTTPQPHLDGAYTLFGQVTRGLELVDTIAPGERIERVEIWTGRE